MSQMRRASTTIPTNNNNRLSSSNQAAYHIRSNSNNVTPRASPHPSRTPQPSRNATPMRGRTSYTPQGGRKGGNSNSNSRNVTPGPRGGMQRASTQQASPAPQSPASAESLKAVLESKDHWKDDSQAKRCEKCNVSFGVIERRHHCRMCGCVFCKTCVSYRSCLSCVHTGLERRRKLETMVLQYQKLVEVKSRELQVTLTKLEVCIYIYIYDFQRPNDPNLNIYIYIYIVDILSV